MALSRQVNGETFEITERAVSQGVLVRSTQDDAGCLVGLEWLYFFASEAAQLVAAQIRPCILFQFF